MATSTAYSYPVFYSLCTIPILHRFLGQFKVPYQWLQLPLFTWSLDESHDTLHHSSSAKLKLFLLPGIVFTSSSCSDLAHMSQIHEYSISVWLLIVVNAILSPNIFMSQNSLVMYSPFDNSTGCTLWVGYPQFHSVEFDKTAIFNFEYTTFYHIFI